MFRQLSDMKGFLKDIITLSSGVGISQVIVFLFQLILRRIYTPEIFGTFDVYLNIYGILVILVTLRYEMAIILPKTDKSAASILVIAILFSFGLNFIFSLFILIFNPLIVKLVKFPVHYSHWLYFLPLTVFFFSAYQAMNYWFIRKKAFFVSAANKVIRRSFEGTAQLGIGYLLSGIGLLLGDLAGNFSNFLFGAFQLKRRNFSIKFISKQKIFYVLRRYVDIPKYNLVPNLLITLSKALPFLFIIRFYNETITGYYGLTKTVLAIPITLIATAISQILLQRITEKRNNNLSLKSDFYINTIMLSVISLFGIIIFYLLGPWLIKVLFGTIWAQSGEYIRILVFSFGITFIVAPLSVIFLALEKIKIQAVWQVAYFLLICLLVFFNELTIEKFLMVYVGLDIIAYTGYFILIIWILKKYETNLVPNK